MRSLRRAAAWSLLALLPAAAVAAPPPEAQAAAFLDQGSVPDLKTDGASQRETEHAEPRREDTRPVSQH
jgi:hypothetical protein